MNNVNLKYFNVYFVFVLIIILILISFNLNFKTGYSIQEISKNLKIIGIENQTINYSNFTLLNMKQKSIKNKVNITNNERLSDDVVFFLGNSNPQDKINILVKNDYGELMEYNLNSSEILNLRAENKIFVNRDYASTLYESTKAINLESKKYKFTGKNISIAILDTGIDNEHEFLRNSIIQEVSFVDEDVGDYNGHGTHVAGIISGKNKYMSGVAPDALIYNVKVLNKNGMGSTKSIVRGIEYAILKDADIISISIGAPYSIPDPLIDEAISKAIKNNIVVITASGNCRQGCNGFNKVMIPGSNRQVITVGSVDNNFDVSSFSSGDDLGYIKPDITAPGENVLSCVPNGFYGEKSGTSMSVPHVAGAVALLLEKTDKNLTHYQVKNILSKTARDFGDVGLDSKYGFGVLDVSEMLEFVDLEEEVEENVELEEVKIEQYDLVFLEEVFDFRLFDSFEQEHEEDVYEFKTGVYFHRELLEDLDLGSSENFFVYGRSYFSVIEFREALYLLFDVYNNSDLEIVRSEYNYYKVGGSYFWFNDRNQVYEVVFENVSGVLDVLDEFSKKTGNVVEKSVLDNILLEEEFENKSLDLMSRIVMQEIYEEGGDLEGFNTLAGGWTKLTADKLKFPSVKRDSYKLKRVNWYEVDVVAEGLLSFDLRGIKKGSNLDLYLYKDGKVIKRSENNDNSNEHITYSKTNNKEEIFYLQVIPREVPIISLASADIDLYGKCNEKKIEDTNECKLTNNWLYVDKQFEDCRIKQVKSIYCKDEIKRQNGYLFCSFDKLYRTSLIFGGRCDMRSDSCKISFRDEFIKEFRKDLVADCSSVGKICRNKKCVFEDEEKEEQFECRVNSDCDSKEKCVNNVCVEISDNSNGDKFVCSRPLNGKTGCSCIEGMNCQMGYTCDKLNGFCFGEDEELKALSAKLVVETLNSGEERQIYINDRLYVSTNQEYETINLDSISSLTDIKVKVQCKNKQGQCKELNNKDEFTIRKNNSYEHIAFDCAICSNNPDIWITPKQINMLDDNKVEVKVYQSAMTGKKINIKMYHQDKEQNSIMSEREYNEEIVLNNYENIITFSTGDKIKNTDYIHVWVDILDEEVDNKNNYVLKPVVRKINIYAEFNLPLKYKDLEPIFLDYLSMYSNVVESKENADLILNIGEGDLIKILGFDEEWQGVIESKDNEVYVYGKDITGTITALKKLISAREIYFDENVLGDKKFLSNKGIALSENTIIINHTDKEALSVRDMIGGNPQMSNNLLTDVRNVLFNNHYQLSVHKVKTLDDTHYKKSTNLRIKNINADYSKNFKDAFEISDVPVVMSGGLFSNLNAFEGFGLELAEDGYNTWLIEMTGGPETDQCKNQDDCPNYKYEDLVEEYYPASIGGILKYTGQSTINYIGHSNGCRVALSSLNEYSEDGKSKAGEYFNYETGKWEEMSLPKKFVDKFFGVACPSTLNNKTTFTILARYKGDEAMKELKDKKHVEMIDYGGRITPDLSDVAEILEIAKFATLYAFSGNKISRNLMQFYNDLANNENSEIDLSRVNISELYLFNGYPTDLIVPFEDGEYLLENINIPQKKMFVQNNIFTLDNHIMIKTNSNVKKNIKENL
jgi:hypothetical protein